MRSFIMVLMLALAGCNNSSDTSVPDNDAAALAQIQALQNQVNALSGQVKQLQLIGRPVGQPVAQTDQVAMFRAMGEPTLAPNDVTTAAPISFGPCQNMGVLIGFIDSNGLPADALSATGQAFRQCTGYQYETKLSTGNIYIGERIFWDGPNCTGNLLEWEAGGAGFNTPSLRNGVVFTNPVDNTTVLMVKAGQIPQPILIQSVWVRENPICQADVEIQPMYQVTPNDVSISGVPSTGVGIFQLGSP